jgi:NADPH:quinone reductase-like Zn-dependent oxidoreductase
MKEVAAVYLCHGLLRRHGTTAGETKAVTSGGFPSGKRSFVVDYRNARFEDHAQDIDMVLDAVGGQTQLRSLATLREGGILVSLVGLSSAARNTDRPVRVASILVEPDAGQLAQIARLVDAGTLQPVVSHRLPLTQVADAHGQSETGRTRGKIVLEVR